MRIDGRKLSSSGWTIESDDELQTLIALMLNPNRRLPVIVASGDARRDDADAPLIDAASMAKAMLGLAHVVALPAKYTHGLTDEFGKALSVFHGAVRTYFPGFDLDGDAYVHRMVLAATLEVPDQAKRALRMIKLSAAKDSLRRLRLNHDVLSYSAVRSAALLADVEKRRTVGGSDSDLVKIAEDEIAVLKQKLAAAELMQKHFSDEHVAAEQRALASEASLSAANVRIDLLNVALVKAEVDIDALEPLPRVC